MIASTSSVYGANPPPFRESDRADHPLSIYAATKKATEDMAHAWAHLFGQPMTLMRFFTVYGPWGRPDMALFKFTRAILSGEPIDLYNGGRMRRDFTFVDDVVEAIARLLPLAPAIGDDGASSAAPCRVVNIAGGAPVELLDYVAAIERAAGRKATRRDLPMQAGDVEATAADTALLARLTGFTPRIRVEEGVRAFVDWYRVWSGA
jgi:UDP-glucuronate 4-epimerase